MPSWSLLPSMTGTALMLGSLLVGFQGGLPGLASAAQTSSQSFELDCRDGVAGPWLPCRMEVERIGERWSLILEEQRIDFRHDGRGVVTMQRENSPWIPVTPSWSDDPALCWDRICAKGNLPLD